jgi:hypothetical protein
LSSKYTDKLARSTPLNSRRITRACTKPKVECLALENDVYCSSLDFATTYLKCRFTQSISFRPRCSNTVSYSSVIYTNVRLALSSIDLRDLSVNTFQSLLLTQLWTLSKEIRSNKIRVVTSVALTMEIRSVVQIRPTSGC